MSRKPVGLGEAEADRSAAPWAMPALLLGLASVLFLAWHLSRTLLPGISSQAADKVKIALLPVLEPPEMGPAGRTEMRLFGILADGVLLHWDEVEREGNWKEETFYPGSRPHLVGERSAGTALSFSARRAQVIFLRTAQSGAILLETEGKEALRADLHAPGNEWDRHVVEVPSRRPAHMAGLAGLAGLLLLFCLWKPWRSAPRTETWLVAYSLLLHAAVWLSFPIGANNDSPGYLHGLEWQLQGFPQYFPPGLGLLILAAKLLPLPGLGLSVTLLQHLMMVATLFWLYRLARAFLPQIWAYGAVLLAASLPPLLYLPQAVYSENLGLFGLVGCLYLLGSARDSGRMRTAVLAGLLGGLSVLARVSPIAVILPAACVLFLLPPSWKRLRLGLAAGGALGLVVLFPMGWFGLKSGKFALADSTGVHLYQKVLHWGGFVAREGPYTKILLELMDGADPRETPHWVMSAKLGQKNISWEQVNTLGHKAAMEGLQEHFPAYLGQTARQIWDQIFMDPCIELAWWGHLLEHCPELENPPLGGVSAASLDSRTLLERLFVPLWGPLVWLALAGTLLAPFLKNRVHAMALAVVAPCYYLAQALVEVLAARYTAMMVPFTILMAGVPLGLLGSALGAGLARLRERRAVPAGERPAEEPRSPAL